MRLARSVGMAGTAVTLTIGAGMQHIFSIYFGFLPEADTAVREIGRWVREKPAIKE